PSVQVQSNPVSFLSSITNCWEIDWNPPARRKNDPKGKPVFRLIYTDWEQDG
ncbi:unnamed protein product, partial [Amoebophrya sp. A25]